MMIKEELSAMKIAMSNDHAGTLMKNEIKAYLESKGIEVLNVGTDTTESVNYPEYGEKVGRAVVSGQADRGIAICGTGTCFPHNVGYGSAMIANKVSGIYACVCQDPFCAQLARQHNDANVLCLGAKIIGGMIAMEIVKTFMATEPLTAEKYVRRVKKVQKINDEHCVPVK